MQIFTLFKVLLVAFFITALGACKIIAPAETIIDEEIVTTPGEKPEDLNEPELELPPAPFELGEILVQTDKLYREFWGMTDDGNYVVQDFYRQGSKKRSNPYTMTRLDDLQTLMLKDEGDITQQYKMLTQSGIGIRGTYVQWYENGQEAMSGDFENSLPVGQWLLNYEDGKIMLQDSWANGLRNGPFKGWHPNGAQAGQGEYVNGQRQGVWTVWYPEGTKMREGPYVDNVQQGNWVFWYDNGYRKEAGTYRNGVRVGLWRWWTRQGALAREAEYDEEGNLGGQTVGSGRIQSRD